MNKKANKPNKKKTNNVMTKEQFKAMKNKDKTNKKKKRMNKKGQAISIIVFFAIIVGVFILSIILMKGTSVILTPFASAVGNQTASAGTSVSYIQSSFVTLWDKVIIAVFVLATISLFVSSFMVDVHPAFIFIYIASLFCLFAFGLPMMDIVKTIFDSPDFVTLQADMPLTYFMISNFGAVLLGIAILSGILMYAKIKLGSGQTPFGNY